MDKRPKYFSKEQPVQCPSCGADKVVPILYGYPSSGAEAAARAGKIVLSGCITTDSDPSWECTICGMQIYPEGPRSRFRSEQKGGRKGRPRIIELQEKVITYKQAELDAWKNGDKQLLPDFVEDRSSLKTQPEYHFGEVFVLRHYYREEGWKGFMSYALGNKNPKSTVRQRGRMKVQELIPAEKLARFQALRGDEWETNFGTGEPDLFLYRDPRECKFVEVKKQTDRMSAKQLKCLALIKGVLEIPVEIVYLCEEMHSHTPRIYILDLDNFQGWKKEYQ
jgi:hypothetical protein